MHCMMYICKPFLFATRIFFLRKQLSCVVNRRIIPVVVVDDPKQPSIVIRIALFISPLPYPAPPIVTTARIWI
uniref:Secreted protein n=1 Tax=Romanomermis culicivorax TaxID=13658 RepID=A0A915KVU6_ROMCU